MTREQKLNQFGVWRVEGGVLSEATLDKCCPNSYVKHSTLDPSNSKLKRAFTLAEVLITLSIIGVIAALTLPTVIANYKKKNTAVRLQKFYSLMKQAILRWEVDEGLDPNQVKFNYMPDDYSKGFQAWYENNLNKYIIDIDKSRKYGKSPNSGNSLSRYTVVLADGSGFNGYISSENLLYIFYCTEAKYCVPDSYDGKNTFLFSLINGNFIAGTNRKASREQILELCQNAGIGNCHNCSRLIQMDGWKIKEDYPIRF